MKFILFFIAFMFLGICMNAQDKQYESFDVKPHVVFIDDGQAEYRSVWIVPPGIEQPMDSLWREYLAKDIHVSIGLDMKKFWTIAICAMLLGAVAFAAVGCNKGAGDTINSIRIEHLGD